MFRPEEASVCSIAAGQYWKACRRCLGGDDGGGTVVLLLQAHVKAQGKNASTLRLWSHFL